jgi:hypothetical protein
MVPLFACTRNVATCGPTSSIVSFLAPNFALDTCRSESGLGACVVGTASSGDVVAGVELRATGSGELAQPLTKARTAPTTRTEDLPVLPMCFKAFSVFGFVRVAPSVLSAHRRPWYTPPPRISNGSCVARTTLIPAFRAATTPEMVCSDSHGGVGPHCHPGAARRCRPGWRRRPRSTRRHRHRSRPAPWAHRAEPAAGRRSDGGAQPRTRPPTRSSRPPLQCRPPEK